MTPKKYDKVKPQTNDNALPISEHKRAMKGLLSVPKAELEREERKERRKKADKGKRGLK